jgi:hypothetical protein
MVAWGDPGRAPASTLHRTTPSMSGTTGFVMATLPQAWPGR